MRREIDPGSQVIRVGRAQINRRDVVKRKADLFERRNREIVRALKPLVRPMRSASVAMVESGLTRIPFPLVIGRPAHDDPTPTLAVEFIRSLPPGNTDIDDSRFRGPRRNFEIQTRSSF